MVSRLFADPRVLSGRRRASRGGDEAWRRPRGLKKAAIGERASAEAAVEKLGDLAAAGTAQRAASAKLLDQLSGA